MPSRRLPQSFVSLAALIRALLGKIAGKPISALLFSAENHARLTTDGPIFLAEMDQASVALRNQVAASGSLLEADALVDLYISVFVQNVNFYIRLKKLIPADRLYYKMDASDDKVPDVRSEADTETWINNIINGEEARIAAGGTGLAFPPLAELKAAHNNWKAKRQQQSDLKDLARKEGLDVVNGFKPMLFTVTDIFDEIEFANRKLPIEASRNYNREHGLPYTNDAGESAEFTKTIAPGETVVFTEMALNETSKVTGTLLTPGGTAKVCRNASGCPTETRELAFNIPFTALSTELSGTDENVSVTNTGTVAVEVLVRVEG